MRFERAVLAVYRRLIRTFPEEFRLDHGANLADTTEDVVRNLILKRGRAGLALQLPRLFADVAIRLVVERWNDVRSDTRFALRLLARAPGFTLAAVLCLALGTGLATAVYTQVQSTVLAELPGSPDAPDALIRVHRPVSFDEYEALRDGGPAVARLAG